MSAYTGDTQKLISDVLDTNYIYYAITLTALRKSDNACAYITTSHRVNRNHMLTDEDLDNQMRIYAYGRALEDLPSEYFYDHKVGMIRITNEWNADDEA